MDSTRNNNNGTPYLCRHTYYLELNEKRRRERQAARARTADHADKRDSGVAKTYRDMGTPEYADARGHKVEQSYPSSAASPSSRTDGSRSRIPQYASLGSRLRDSSVLDSVIARVASWLEIDDKACRVESKPKRLPLGIIAAMLAIAMSLMLIVAGAVISSKAKMELYAAENRLGELKSTELALSQQLELKTDLRYIEQQARERLGMIDREHASVLALDGAQDDKVEIYRYSSGKTAITALLDALGFLGE